MPIESIRRLAAKALEEKAVDAVIGFTSGRTPLATRVHTAQNLPGTEKLVWNDFCVANLAKHLLKSDKRLGVIANGCTARTIVVYLNEKQLNREDLYIIGVPCRGMLDRHKIKKLLGKRKIRRRASEPDSVLLSAEDFERQLGREELLRDNCANCRHRNPVLYDVLATELLPETVDETVLDRDILALEALSPRERGDYFRSLLSPCTLCYACRNACPVCYCPTCFVDKAESPGIHKTARDGDPLLFHILRTMHCAGRCVDCGACDSACPQGIPVSKLTRKLNRDLRAFHQFEAGLDPETAPPLSVFEVEDPQDFVLTEQLRSKSTTNRT